MAGLVYFILKRQKINNYDESLNIDDYVLNRIVEEAIMYIITLEGFGRFTPKTKA